MESCDPVCICKTRGVPEHLHTHQQETRNDFADSELLFIRFPVEERKLKTILGFRRQSSNRSKFCKNADDVLFNTEEGGRYENCGVVQVPVERLRAINVKHPSEPKEYTVIPEHVPTECNYPHTEIVAHENGIAVKDITPKSVKKAIREQLHDAITIAVPLSAKGELLDNS